MLMEAIRREAPSTTRLVLQCLRNPAIAAIPVGLLVGLSGVTLPYEGADVQAMNPRLRNAKALVEQGAVKWDGDTALVGDYRVNGEACTCQWWAEYRGGRGKCKHVLAADMVKEKA